MRRRVLLCLTLISSMSACKGDKLTDPATSPTSPTAAISDATHGPGLLGGNPEFFFLPPMVSNPNASPLWDAEAFNPDLAATVEICDVAKLATGVADTKCVAGTTVTYRARVDGNAEQYQVDWKVPTSATTFYRITVKVGSVTLGFADVETGSSTGQLKKASTGEFIPLQDGRTLPVKFRIERYALCEHPEDPSKPCASKSVDLSIGGTVAVTLPDTKEPSGIVIPSQGSTAPQVLVTVQSCEDINPRATDLRTFGPCFRVTADNGSTEAATHFVFTNAATVFSCDVDAAVHAAIDAHTLTAAQEPLVTLHRLDDYGTPTQRIAALQHVPACGKGVSSAGTVLKGMLASLAHGNFRGAARQAAALVTPEPLYASMFIDLGGGGFTEQLSDFQFALPAKMDIVAGVDGQSAYAGDVLNPTVRVTDLHGDPIMGATVHFNSSDPAASIGTIATTGPSGYASMPWTVGFGANALPVSGRGIASPRNDGPRDRFDPFQPIHHALGFDDALDGPEEPVGLGALLFSVTGIDGFEATDWPALTGYWHRSTLASPTSGPFTNVAFTLALVNAGKRDYSAGALPTPAAGTRALWFGSDAHGNYAGPLADGETGGTSFGRNSGTATSPAFLVPASGDVTLTFRSWFEIESVNPSRWDLMRVLIREVGSGSFAELAKLNPPGDPEGSSLTPFTSGGFDMPPVWTLESAGLNAYRGRRVEVVFSFDTVDPLYNGFRGWVVDDVTVRSVAGLTTSTIAVPLRATLNVVPTDAPPPRTWRP
jgi:hypothetical protein